MTIFETTYDKPGLSTLFNPGSMEASFGLDGNDSFNSRANSRAGIKVNIDGLYVTLPSLSSGGTGDDKYAVGGRTGDDQYAVIGSDSAFIADAGSGNDYLRIYRSLNELVRYARIDGRHLMLTFGFPFSRSTNTVLFIFDAFRPDGSIEKMEFNDNVILNTTWNQLPSPFRSSKIPFEELTWDQINGDAFTFDALLDEIYIKGNPVTQPGVHRFFNPFKGVHFYSNDLNEINSVRSRLGNQQYEGKAYDPVTGIGATNLNRFFNPKAGYHFMTASDAEAQSVRMHPEWGYQDEGKSYAVSTSLSAFATKPVYRFYKVDDGIGRHFYTSSEAEKANVISNSSMGYQYEGIAWYAQ